MNAVLWIIAGLLAAVFATAGALKLTQPREKLLAAGMAWTGDFSDGTVKLIGALELLAAVGLILPALLDVVPVLVPLAALGLVLVMVGGAVVHARHKEYPNIIGNVVLLALAAVVVWGRFGPHSFSS